VARQGHGVACRLPLYEVAEGEGRVLGHRLEEGGHVHPGEVGAEVEAVLVVPAAVVAVEPRLLVLVEQHRHLEVDVRARAPDAAPGVAEPTERLATADPLPLPDADGVEVGVERVNRHAVPVVAEDDVTAEGRAHALVDVDDRTPTRSTDRVEGFALRIAERRADVEPCVELREARTGVGHDGAAHEAVLPGLPARLAEAGDGVAFDLHVEARKVAGEEAEVARRKGERQRGRIRERRARLDAKDVRRPRLVRRHVARGEGEEESRYERTQPKGNAHKGNAHKGNAHGVGGRMERAERPRAREQGAAWTQEDRGAVSSSERIGVFHRGRPLPEAARIRGLCRRLDPRSSSSSVRSPMRLLLAALVLATATPARAQFFTVLDDLFDNVNAIVFYGQMGRLVSEDDIQGTA